MEENGLDVLTGMLDIFVIGSMRSTQPMLTSGIQRAQDTCAHFCPERVHFMAPPLLGQSTHSGRRLRAQVRHSQEPDGIVVMP